MEGPLIFDGVDGNRVSVALLEELPPHEFTAVTESIPDINVAGMFKVMVFALFVTMLHPLGTTQL